MDFGTIAGGLVQGALGGIDLTNRYNQMRAISDETDIRRAQAQALKAPFDPEKDWAGEFQQLPPETQQFFKEGIKKYGATRMGMMNTMKDYSDKEGLMTQLVDAKLKKKQIDWSDSYSKLQQAQAQGLDTTELEKEVTAKAADAMDIGTKAKAYLDNRKIANFYKEATPEEQVVIKKYLSANDYEGAKSAIEKLEAAKIENQKFQRNTAEKYNQIDYKQGLKGEGAVGSTFETGANYDRLIKAKETYEENPTADNLMIVQDLAGKLNYEYSPTTTKYNRYIGTLKIPGTESSETTYQLKKATKGGSATGRSANLNPGNIKLGGQTRKWVQSGAATVDPKPAKDGGNFLKFKDPQTGFDAAKDLMFSPLYSNLTTEQALRQWSHGGYGAEIVPELKNKKINELNDGEKTYLFARLMKREGTITKLGKSKDGRIVAQLKTGENVYVN